MNYVFLGEGVGGGEGGGGGGMLEKKTKSRRRRGWEGECKERSMCLADCIDSERDRFTIKGAL